MDHFSRQLVNMHPALLRTARSRLRNQDWAEDAVSETLLAALESRPDFVEPTRVRAWLFGILRHKVVDQLRTHLRDEEVTAISDGAEGDSREIGDPSSWANPVQRLADQQFVMALNGQLRRLPRMHAHAVVMRDCLGASAPEICHALDVSAGHLGVMLHRARQRLRQGLWDHHS